MIIPASPPDAPERLAWLRLARTPQVGPVTFRDLIARFGSPHAALDAAPRLARRGGARKPIVAPSEEDARAELEALDSAGARLLLSCDADFPPRLAALDPPPPVIAVLGAKPLTAPRAIAMVGSRNASAAGRRLAHDLAAELAEAGVLILSGLARGIDAAVHHGALERPGGTVAVLAGGLDQVYPPENRELHLAIAQHGALVSERPMGATPTSRDFPRRNRLVSGLADGVVVVEAAERSGSLITARYGADQGREVMAVPGNPLDPRAKGANRLIKEGAALVETAEDVLNAVARPLRLEEPERDVRALFDLKPSTLEKEADSVREQLRTLLSPTPVARDELVRQTGASAAAVVAALMELELAGEAIRLPGDMVAAAAPSDARD